MHSKWDGRDISLFLFVSHTGPVCIISQYLSKLLFFLKKKKKIGISVKGCVIAGGHLTVTFICD